jgi:hypothetical protein
VNAHRDSALGDLQTMLKEGTYKVSDYKVRVINDRGKERKLMALPYYPDRIIQWAIMLHLEEMFTNSFNSFSCASIRGRGTHYAKRMVQKWLREDAAGTKYCLKLDVKKFYDNVDHDILKEKLRTKIKDERLLKLLDTIIDSIPDGKGIPIGSLLSQNFANFYLTSLDNYLKHELKEKYVVRYMDDIVVLGGSKERLHAVFAAIQKHLAGLKLSVKENYQIFPVDVRGIDFVGYRIFRRYVLLRKSICKRFKARAIELRRGINSAKNMASMAAYNGWVKHCNGYRLRNKYLAGGVVATVIRGVVSKWRRDFYLQ